MLLSTMIKAINAASMSNEQKKAFIGALEKDSIILGKCDTSFLIVEKHMIKTPEVKAIINGIKDHLSDEIVLEMTPKILRQEFNKMALNSINSLWSISDIIDVLTTPISSSPEWDKLVENNQPIIWGDSVDESDSVDEFESVDEFDSGYSVDSGDSVDELSHIMFIASGKSTCVFDLKFHLNGGTQNKKNTPCRSDPCTNAHISHEKKIRVRGYKVVGECIHQIKGRAYLYKKNNIWMHRF
jgi:hypothetical protein